MEFDPNPDPFNKYYEVMVQLLQAERNVVSLSWWSCFWRSEDADDAAQVLQEAIERGSAICQHGVLESWQKRTLGEELFTAERLYFKRVSWHYGD